MDMMPRLLQQAPLRLGFCRCRPNADLARGLAFLHSTPAARPEPFRRLSRTAPAGTALCRSLPAADLVSMSEERQASSPTSDSTDGSHVENPFVHRLGLDHRIAVRCSGTRSLPLCTRLGLAHNVLSA